MPYGFTSTWNLKKKKKKNKQTKQKQTPRYKELSGGCGGRGGGEWGGMSKTGEGIKGTDFQLQIN